MAAVLVHTEHAPKAIGPYSQATVHNGTVYVSGQIPIDLATNAVVESEDIRVQTRLVLSHLNAVLTAAGSSMGKVLKTTVLLKDMNDFAAMNECYAEAFGDHRPARAAFQAAKLPRDVRVEIECIAYI